MMLLGVPMPPAEGSVAVMPVLHSLRSSERAPESPVNKRRR